MLKDNKKAAAISRLNRAQGQIKAVGRYVGSLACRMRPITNGARSMAGWAWIRRVV